MPRAVSWDSMSEMTDVTEARAAWGSPCAGIGAPDGPVGPALPGDEAAPAMREIGEKFDEAPPLGSCEPDMGVAIKRLLLAS